MTEIASEGYEDDVYDGLMRKKKGGAEAFLATAEGRDRIKSLLEDHLADVLRTLHSNFFHYTLSTQITPLSTILPEIHSSTSTESTKTAFKRNPTSSSLQVITFATPSSPNSPSFALSYHLNRTGEENHSMRNLGFSRRGNGGRSRVR